MICVKVLFLLEGSFYWKKHGIDNMTKYPWKVIDKNVLLSLHNECDFIQIVLFPSEALETKIYYLRRLDTCMMICTVKTANAV